MSKNFKVYFIHIHFFKKSNKKIYNGVKELTAMLLYLYLDSLLSTCQKKMETEKWPKAVDSPLFIIYFYLFKQLQRIFTICMMQ